MIVTEYSIQPTSLEQIFNKFAQAQIAVQNVDKKNKKKYEEVPQIKEIKNEILVNEELLKEILN